MLVRTIAGNLRGKFGNGAGTITYIFTELNVGYRMQRGALPTDCREHVDL